MNRDFKGIWIPKEIWLNEKLTIQEKIFLVEIDSLDNESGCFAGNAYFSEFFGISKTRVSLVIKSLIEKGFVSSTTVYKEGTKQILKRVLNICYRPYTTKVNEPPQQILKTPIQQKLKDNNTVISNKIKNKINNNDQKKILEDNINEIYKAYPRKVGKPKALASIKKALNKISFEELLSKVILFAKSRENEDPKFTPHPSTWFNEERWNDTEDFNPKRKFVQQSLFKNKPQLGVNKLTQEERDEMPF
tara:strand:- start:757 stop:1497 length:741 start_codon:yes stop_codon:yes gene_type:complete